MASVWEPIKLEDRQKFMQQFTKLSALVLFSLCSLIASPTKPALASAKSKTAIPSATTLRITFGSGGFGSSGARSVSLLLATRSGELYQSVPTTSSYPRPTLEAFSLLKLSKADYQSMIKLAVAANLNRRLDLGTPPTADVPPLIVSYVGITNVIQSFGIGDDTMPTKQLEGRKKLKALIVFLQSRPGAKVSRPTSIAVMPRNAEGQLSTDASLQQTPRPWPAAASDLREMGGCKVVTGAEAIAAFTALRTANDLTPWTSSGYTYLVSARPVLPGDPGCG